MEKETFTCKDCGRIFSRNFNLRRHIETYHNSEQSVEKCFICGQIFTSCEDLLKHIENSHKTSKKFVLVESAFEKSILTYRYTYSENVGDMLQAQNIVRNEIKKIIKIEASKKNVIKVGLVIVPQMSMLDNKNESITNAAIPFRASNFLANAAFPNNIRKNINKAFKEHHAHLEDFTNNGSNWVFNKALVFHIEIAAVKPLVGGSNDADVKKISIENFKNKKFLYNPCNNDEKCFLYCIAYSQYGKHFENTTSKKIDLKLKKYIKTFNVENISFPTSIEDIKKFLKRNPQLDIKINILYQDKDGKIYPLEYGLGNGKKFVNLLMLQRKKEDSAVNHFLLIKNADKYLRSVYKCANGSVSYQKTNYCLNCLHSFSSNSNLKEHERLCVMNKPRLEVLPESNDNSNYLHFKNVENQHFKEYVGFLDFECVLPKEKTRCDVCKTIRCKCDQSFTDILSRQEPVGFSFIVLNGQKVKHQQTFIGKNAAENFVQHLLDIEDNVMEILSKCEPLKMSEKQNRKFEQTNMCYLCNVEFSDAVIKNKDHSHVSGKYLGAACTNCNLRRRKQNRLKIFVHNGSRYKFYSGCSIIYCI